MAIRASSFPLGGLMFAADFILTDFVVGATMMSKTVTSRIRSKKKLTRESRANLRIGLSFQDRMGL